VVPGKHFPTRFYHDSYKFANKSGISLLDAKRNAAMAVGCRLKRSTEVPFQVKVVSFLRDGQEIDIEKEESLEFLKAKTLRWPFEGGSSRQTKMPLLWLANL